jgi:two-component system response regulator MprA
MADRTDRARILIVDDDEAVLHTLASALMLEGYDVRTAATPQIGLVEVETARPHAILLDLNMPFVNGLGFLYRLRASEKFRDTPVAIITASTPNEAALEELHQLGAEVWFKPLWIDEVLKVTRGLLSKHSPDALGVGPEPGAPGER